MPTWASRASAPPCSRPHSTSTCGRSTGVTPENTMHAQVSSRVVCRRLDWNLSAADVLRLLRADPHPVALLGAWAGGSDIMAACPVRTGGELDAADAGDLPERAGGACFGGGWIGYLGFGGTGSMPPAPAAPPGLPARWLRYSDHVPRGHRPTATG